MVKFTSVKQPKFIHLILLIFTREATNTKKLINHQTLARKERGIKDAES